MCFKNPYRLWGKRWPEKITSPSGRSRNFVPGVMRVLVEKQLKDSLLGLGCAAEG